MIYTFGVMDGVSSFAIYRSFADQNLDGIKVYPHIQTNDYLDFFREEERKFFDGVYIFTSMQWLDVLQLQRIAGLARWLRESPLRVRVLNDPIRYVDRYELLRILFEEGVNRHNVYRLSEHRMPQSWPVFLRSIPGHWRTELLHDEKELKARIARLAEDGIWHGGIMIVEFNDTSDGDGFYRKDSAFRIGDRIVPWRVVIAKDWWVRRDNLDPKDLLDEDSLVAEELKYIESNPHADWLMPYFERFGIEYGRIDYSMLGDQIQVWEINTAPSLLKRSFFDTRPQARPALNRVSELFYEAFAELDFVSRERRPSAQD